MGRFVFLSFFIIISFNVNSQTVYRGCKTGNSINNYTNNTVLGNPYYATFAYSTIAPSCPRAQTTGSRIGTCNLTSSGVFGAQGDLYDYIILNPPIDCPLDDYIWILILSLSGLGFYYMRSRSLHKLSAQL